MNAITKPALVPAASRPTKLEIFMGQVLPPDKREAIARSLPAHVPMARFERNLSNAVMQTPDLMQCPPAMVFKEVSKLAALGLYCDPQLGEAWLIVGYNKKEKRKEPQARVGYRGLMKLGRQSGEVAALYAHEVHANDEIECNLGVEKRLVHKPLLFGDRGPVIGYYAVVKYKDGETDFEPMTMEQINKIRERSDAWKAGQFGPWKSDPEEMAKKTVIRRLCKRIPQSPDLADAWKLEDAADAPMTDVTPEKPRITAAQALAAIGEPADDKIDVGNGVVLDRQDVSDAADLAEAELERMVDQGFPPDPAQPAADAPGLPLGDDPPFDAAMAEAAILQQLPMLKTRAAVSTYINVSKADAIAKIKASDNGEAAWLRIMEAADLRKEQVK